MMGVYTPDMKLPSSCLFCDIPVRVQPCPVDHDNVSNYKSSRHPACPLIPVPPHGRLIDANALWVEINKICDRRDAGIITDLTCLQQILSALRHAPTIIPAEEKSKEEDEEK